MEKYIFRLIVHRCFHLPVQLLMACCLLISWDHFLCRDHDPGVFLQQRIAHIKMIQQHSRLFPEALVFYGILNKNLLTRPGRSDLSLKYHIFTKQFCFPHFPLDRHHIGVLLPPGPGPCMLCRRGPDPAVHGIVLSL